MLFFSLSFFDLNLVYMFFFAFFFSDKDYLISMNRKLKVMGKTWFPRRAIGKASPILMR